MSGEKLHREDAPFSEKLWRHIDESVVSAAKGRLSARRLLHIDGPLGFDVRSVGAGESHLETSPADDSVSVSAGEPIRLALIEREFTLSARDVAAFEADNGPMDLAPATEAAIACAAREDELIFNGSKSLGAEGLLTAKGALKSSLSSWQEVGKAADDVIAAVTKLDEAGFHGPCTLALAPSLYNLLYRRYPQGNQTELEHVRQITGGGVVKAAAIDNGGVLVASGRQFASILVGLDLTTDFIGPAGSNYELVAMESVALWLKARSAVCVLKK
ncbi:MAG: family 1 encapsulin nanocompartment shell protein [Phycisphaerae bacterium]